MPFEDDLDFRTGASPTVDVEEAESRAAKFAAVLGVMLIAGVVGTAVWAGWKILSRVEAPPPNQKAAKPKYLPATQTEFVVDAKPLDGSRYAGPIDGYYLRGMDAARKLIAEHTNRQIETINLANSMSELGGSPTRHVKKNTPPGPGCKPKDVQDYFSKVNPPVEFLQLPDDEVWGYDTKTGKVYIGLRP